MSPHSSALTLLDSDDHYSRRARSARESHRVSPGRAHARRALDSARADNHSPATGLQSRLPSLGCQLLPRQSRWRASSGPTPLRSAPQARHAQITLRSRQALRLLYRWPLHRHLHTSVNRQPSLRSPGVGAFLLPSFSSALTLLDSDDSPLHRVADCRSRPRDGWHSHRCRPPRRSNTPSMR